MFARLMLFSALCVLLASAQIISAPSALAQSPAKIKSDEEQIRDTMVVISRQLGVTCTTCHNTDNFKSDKKMEFQVAKEHMKITQMLIDSGMNGQKGAPKADCYMCHRGELKPHYQEPPHPLTK